MEMFLQSNFNGTYSVSVKNTTDRKVFTEDYIIILDNVSRNMTFQCLYELLKEKFGCRKLVIDF